MNETLKAAGHIGAELGAAMAEIEALREQVRALQSDANSWQSGYDKGRLDGAKHRKSEVEQLRQHKNEYMDAAEVTRKALLAEIESLRNGLKNARYRIEQGRVWSGMGWTLTGLHAHQQQKALDEIDAALSKQAEPVEQAPAQDGRKTFEVEIPDISAIYDGRSFIPYRSLEAGERLMTVAQHLRIEKQLRAALTRPAQTAPQPEQSGLVKVAQGALVEIQAVLEDAYLNAYPECCGQAHLECCGSPLQAWSEADQKTMERFAPVERALRAALSATPSPAMDAKEE